MSAAPVPREEGTQTRGPRAQTQMRGWNSRPECKASGPSWGRNEGSLR